MNPLATGKWKRRGTGVPTAEEVAEMNATVSMQARIRQVTQAILANGGTPEDVRRAVLGIAGAPQNTRQFTAPGTFGVKIAGRTIPVSFDAATGQYFLPDGKTPVPNNAEMVRMSGSTGGGVPRTAKEPDPNSSTGWSRVFYDTASGVELYRVDDTPYTPPPDFGPSTVILDANGNPTVYQPPRNVGGPTRVLGTAVSPAAPQREQTDAQAFLATVDKAIAAAQIGPGGIRKQLLPGQQDAIVKQQAVAARLPYQTYFEVQQAARTRSTPPPQANAPPAPGGTPAGGIDTNALRQRTLEIEAALKGGPPRQPGRAGGPGRVGSPGR